MNATPFGHYQLQKLIGQGGMGEVYQAYDTKTDRVVALKVLPHHMAQDETFQTRFRRESQAAAGINDPHVVPIHGYGEIDGRLYLDMRLIEGEDLASLLRREISARTPFLDLGAHPRSLEILRLTSMPAVCLELGYLSNRLDAERLSDESLREVITEGAIAAIQRYYLDAPDDFQTGTWRLPPELRTSRST